LYLTDNLKNNLFRGNFPLGSGNGGSANPALLYQAHPESGPDVAP
jgi:hypothetical protein